MKNNTDSKLKIAREKANITQLEVAEKLKIHVNYYARIERGEVLPSTDLLKKLTKLFNLKSTDILSF